MGWGEDNVTYLRTVGFARDDDDGGLHPGVQHDCALDPWGRPSVSGCDVEPQALLPFLQQDGVGDVTQGLLSPQRSHGRALQAILVGTAPHHAHGHLCSSGSDGGGHCGHVVPEL